MIKFEKNYSQASQDLFAYYLCDTDNGYFVDIGAGAPIVNNNTYFLEEKGWNGISFDISDYRREYNDNRDTLFIISDVNKIPINRYLKYYNSPRVIDYLSIDIDDSTEYFLLNNFPEDYEFKIITFEHNACRDGNDLKNKANKFFIERGYTLLCENVAVSYTTNHDEFEDWYINEKYLKKDLNYLKLNKKHHTEIIKKITEKHFTNEMKICLYTLNLNEEKILPFFLDYYTNYVGVNKIVIYDGGSTDRSKDIINNYSNTVLIEGNDKETDSARDLIIWNEEWKKDRNDYDWMIVCTTDEFLYHPDLRNKLLEYKEQGITIPRIEGFDMISINFPSYEIGYYLPYQIKKGIKDPVFLNKNIIFNPKELDINYKAGCHLCDPTGKVIYSENYDFKLLHYKWLSYDFLIEDSTRKEKRLSDEMIKDSRGFQYKLYKEKSIEDYTERYSRAVEVLGDFINVQENHLYNLFKDYTHVEIQNNSCIIVNFHIDMILENAKILIKDINNNMIMYDEKTIGPNINYWCYPDNKNYLNGFYVEIYDKHDNFLFRSKIIENNNKNK